MAEAPALRSAEPGIRCTRWMDFDQADTQAEEVVHSRLLVGLPGQVAPRLDTAAVPGPDPAPHCPPAARESVHSAHRAADRPDPSYPAGPGLESVEPSRPAAVPPRPEPKRDLHSAPRKAAMANDLFLLDSFPCNPPCPGWTPDLSAKAYCIDGVAHSPSLVLTQPYGKSYSTAVPRHRLKVTTR